MSTADTMGRARLEEFRRSDPDVADLAAAVALAVRIEPALLRAARLYLVAHLDAGAESDLWFSDLVGSRSSQAITLDPEVAAALRYDLARRRVPGDRAAARAWLSRAREVVKAAHAHESPAILLEEEVIWLTVLDEPGADQAIEKAFRRAVKAMVSDAERGLQVARWADRALPTLPETVLRSPAARLLAMGTSARLGDRARVGRRAEVAAVPGADWVRPEVGSADSVEVGLQLVEGALYFTAPDVLGSTPLPLPGNDARLVTVQWEDTNGPQERLSAAAVGHHVPLSTDVRSVRIETAAGAVYRLSSSQSSRVALVFRNEAQAAFRELADRDRAAVRGAILRLSEDPFGASKAVKEAVRRYESGSPPVSIEFVFETAAEASLTPNTQVIDVLRVEVVRAEGAEEPKESRLNAFLDADLRIFISHCHEDHEWLEDLHLHLESVTSGRSEKVAVWDDTQIDSGSSLEDQMERAARSAQVAIVFVSHRHLSSDFGKWELDILLARAKSGDLTLLPIAVSESLFEETELVSYQFVNKPSLPLNSLEPADRARVMADVAFRIRKELEDNAALAREVAREVRAIFEERLPRHLAENPDLVEKVNAVYKFVITGEGGGRWRVDLTVPGGAVYEGDGEAQCTVQMSDRDFVDLVNGALNAQMAFMSGKMKIKGDMSMALKMGALFNFRKPR